MSAREYTSAGRIAIRKTGMVIFIKDINMFKLFEDEYRFHIIQIRKISKDIFIEKDSREKDIFLFFSPF